MKTMLLATGVAAAVFAGCAAMNDDAAYRREAAEVVAGTSTRAASRRWTA
ncbi:MAG: hypothetical protein U1F45_00110 [Burkholderiales bacterium]